MGLPVHAEEQRQAAPWLCVAAVVLTGAAMVVHSPAPGWSAGIVVAAAGGLQLAGTLLRRLPEARQTAGELATGAGLMLLVAGAVATAGLDVSVVVFIGALLAGQATLCTIWHSSAAAMLGASLAIGVTAWMVGLGAASAVAGALGLGAIGLSLAAGSMAQHQQRAALARHLRRVHGDLKSHHSAEQELRATHDSLERQAIVLSEGHRRLEREMEARRWAEEQALEVARIKDSFLHVISHELRTPLNAVIGYTEILLDEDPELPLRAIRGEHEKIHASAYRLLSLIDDLLDLAKIEAGKTAVDVETVDIAELAEHVLAALAVTAASNRDTLRLRCEQQLPPLRTDRAKLRRILFHLLSNACKFTRDGVVRLAVRLERTGEPWFIFEVSDTGIGMDEATLARIFAPFTQADASTTRRYDGTGLGLAICKHYCAMLGGQLSAISTPGAGSTFTMRLPATRVDPRAAGVIVQSMW